MIEKLKSICEERHIPFILEKLSLHKDSLDNYYGLLYNCMGTGVHFDQSEINEEECQAENIKIYHTWTSIF